MKSILITLIFSLGLTFMVQAQAPESIKYQAAIRDKDGKAIVNSSVGVKISILKDSANGTATYTETFTVTTTASGIINIQLGKGTATNGIFSEIDWSTGSYFVELSLDLNGGSTYVLVGSTQLVSVPYSLHSKTTESSQVVTKSTRDAMVDITVGTLIFCSDCGAKGELQVYNGTEWTNMVGGAVVE